jgi:hypothetical protein
MRRPDARIKPSLLTTISQQGIGTSDKSTHEVCRRDHDTSAQMLRTIWSNSNEKAADMRLSTTCPLRKMGANTLLKSFGPKYTDEVRHFIPIMYAE